MTELFAVKVMALNSNRFFEGFCSKEQYHWDAFVYVWNVNSAKKRKYYLCVTQTDYK